MPFYSYSLYERHAPLLVLPQRIIGQHSQSLYRRTDTCQENQLHNGSLSRRAAVQQYQVIRFFPYALKIGVFVLILCNTIEIQQPKTTLLVHVPADRNLSREPATPQLPILPCSCAVTDFIKNTWCRVAYICFECLRRF